MDYLPDPGNYTWTLDRASSAFTATTESGQTLTASLEELTDNRYSLVGRTVRDKANGQIIWNIPLDREFRVSLPAYGPPILANQVPPSQRSGLNNESSTYATSIETQFVLPNGEERTIDINYLGLTPIGRAVLYNPHTALRRQFMDVPIGPQQQEIINQLLDQGYHIASVHELTQRSIAGWLISKQRDLLTELINLGATDENGEELLDEYDAAGFLARVISSGTDVYEIGW